MFGGFRSKRPVLMVAILVGIAGGLYWFASERRPLLEEFGSQSPEPAYRAANRVDVAPATAGNLAKHAPGTDEPPLWRAVDEGSVGRLPFFAKEWSPEGRVLIRITGASAAAQAWQVGDRLTIPLPQTGEIYRPVIEQIDDGPGSSRAALAKVLDADGYPRRIVVTVGPTSAFAYIDTPEGPYELVAGIDYGWLLPTSSMMAGYDFSKPDYILRD